jgi:hypothetical protein
MSGYLRYDNFHFDGEGYFANLTIPNLEVNYLFKNDVVKNWFKNSEINIQLMDILHHLTNGDLSIFRKIFIEFCQSSFSYFDVSGNEPERFYHAFVLGLIVSLRNNYTIRSNRESGYGRYDIMLIPKDKNERAFIFEFKKVDKFEKENMQSAMEDAKKQIKEKKYAQELLELGMNNIYNIAAVFEKKEIEVEIWSETNDK